MTMKRVPFIVLLSVVALVLITLPLLLDRYYLHVFIMIYLFAYLSTCWNIMGGYIGTFSFGHTAFFGIGAYISTILLVSLNVTPWVGFLIGGLGGMLFGFSIGYVSFKCGLRGPFFAMTTLAFAEILRVIANNWDAVGAANGIIIPLKGGDSLYFIQFLSKAPYYYVALLLMVIGIAVMYFITGARLGEYFFAIREDEEAAEALGIDTLKYKIVGIMISSFLTAVGGAFYVQYISFIDPHIAFGVGTSIEILLPTVVGGVGTIWGPILGSLILTPLTEASRIMLGRYAGVHLAAYGTVLVFVIIFMPKGVLREIQRLYAYIFSRQRGEEVI